MLIGLGVATGRKQYKRTLVSGKLAHKTNSFLAASTLCQRNCNHRGCSFKSHTSIQLLQPDWGSHLRPSCLQTTLASQSVQWSAQMVPQSPLKYSSTLLSSANRTAPSKREKKPTKNQLLSADWSFRPASLGLACSWAELHLASFILFCLCWH